MLGTKTVGLNDRTLYTSICTYNSRTIWDHFYWLKLVLLGANLTIKKSTNKLFNPIFCHCLHWKWFKRKRWGRCLSLGFLTHQFYQSMTLLWSRSITLGYFYQHLFVNRALTFLSRQTIRVNGSCTIKDEDLRILNFLGIIEPPFWNTGIWKWKHI